jgi:hypothetical protein
MSVDPDIIDEIYVQIKRGVPWRRIDIDLRNRGFTEQEIAEIQDRADEKLQTKEKRSLHDEQ